MWTLAVSGLCLLFAVGVWLRDEARRREPLPLRYVCAGNLRLLGQACHVYNEQYGSSPDSLGQLVRFMRSTGASPGASGDCPLAPSGGRAYVYYRGLDLDGRDPTHWILMHDRLSNHPDGSVNVVYIDGHVEWLSKERFASELKEFIKEFTHEHGHPPSSAAP